MLEYIFAVLEWCKVSIFLREKDKKVFFKEGEIWWCSIGMNVGAEIWGKGSKFTRPVLIFKRFDANFFLGIPLTSKPKEGNWYVPVEYANRKNWVILPQARVLDVQRLSKNMGTLNAENFEKVRNAFLRLYGKNEIPTPKNNHPADEAGIVGKSHNGKSRI